MLNIFRSLLALFVFMPALVQAALFDREYVRGACPENVFVKKSDTYLIEADGSKQQRVLQGSFFGFNVEWIEFQLSMWDEARWRTRADVIDLLKPFAGAVYRYPGGGDGAANDLDWREAGFSRGDRPKAPRAGWTPPISLQFGPEEYLDFVTDVGGTAWYVANLHGRESGELKPERMAAEAGALASRLAELRATGKPTVMRWELGNELDRNKWRWPPEKLARVASMVASEIRRADSQAKFLVLQQEYPAMQKEGYTASAYNQSLAKGVQGVASEFAVHLYFDGGRSGPPLPRKLLALCSAIEDVKAVRPELKAPAFWITETARVPEGMWEKDSKKVWTQTANLQSAIGVADMFITAAMIPEVQGAFVHTLHGTDGPWPLLHRTRDKSRIYPSVVMNALRILRDSMLPVVLSTRTSSPNNSNYSGGYDLHSIVMSDEARQRYSVWSVNRSSSPETVRLRITGVSNRKLKAVVEVLSDAQLEANNYVNSERLKSVRSELVLDFDREGQATLSLPGHAVHTVRFDTTR